MSTTATDAAPAADAQPKAETKPTELKSKDTGVLSALRTADTANPPPKAAKPEGKKPAVETDSHAHPADKGPDADSPAEHQDDERPLEPWMRKRLTRAEEKGRKQASAEILDVIRGLRQAPAEQPTKATPADVKAADQPKNLADFDYDVEKFTQHQIREGVKTALAERDAENDERKAQAKAEEARTAFERRKAEFESRAGDGAWDEMISLQVDVPQEVIDILMGHDRDLDIAHYLVRNPKELAELKGKSKLAIAQRLASIDTKLSGKSNVTELPPKTTKAPPPPDELPSGTKTVKSIDNMSTAERIATWRAQKSKSR